MNALVGHILGVGKDFYNNCARMTTVQDKVPSHEA